MVHIIDTQTMVRIVHLTRGRIRMRLDEVRSRPGVASQLHKQLMAVSGIHRVDIKSRTGSVLLTYDPRALGSADFLDEFSTAMGKLFPAYFAPGRLRIRIDLLRGRRKLARRIQQLLAPVGGIHRLEIDPADGACFLVYDSQMVTSPEFIDLVSRSLAVVLPQFDVKKIVSRAGLGRR